MAWPVIEGERMSLRPPRADDTGSLVAILAEPEVSRWWVGYTPERVSAELLDSGDGLVIEIDGSCAGLVLLYPNADAEYLHTVIHLFLGERWYGKRYGAEALALAIGQLSREGHHRFTLDPNVNNAPAIRSYERGSGRTGLAAVGRGVLIAASV